MLGGAIMITALVQFQLSSPVSLAEATQRFEATAPKYQKLPGLIRKYYIRSEDGRVVGGGYLWQTRQAAERVYSAEWRERIVQLYGTKPRINWLYRPAVGGERTVVMREQAACAAL